MARGLPGVRVGPMDPDKTADFGQVSKDKSARQLIKLHARMHPHALRRALARPLDPERTKGLVMEEVRGYLAGQELDNGDPLVPEGAEVEGAQVRGQRDREQVLTFTYRNKAGRSAKWFAPFDPAELPESADKGDELVHVQEMRDRGQVAWDSEGTSTELLRRQVGGLRRENEALRKLIDGKGKNGELPDQTETDVRADTRIVDENEQARREVTELRERAAQLEAALDEQTKRKLQEEGQEGARRAGRGQQEEGGEDEEVPAVEEEEPVEGYDELNARDVISRIRGTDDRDEIESILAYEKRHAARKSVVTAANAVLDKPE